MNFSSVFELSNLNGTNGFIINGIDQFDGLGSSVSYAGDVNGDGFDDIIIGARFADPVGNVGPGQSYVIFGKNGTFSSTLESSNLNGNNGFTINGINDFDFLGTSVSNAGDINGDGLDDLIISATGGDPNNKSEAGESYIVFGKSSGFPSTFELSNLNGNNGFIINGIQERDGSGFVVSNAGDVNGDGIDDLIISTPTAVRGNVYGAGETYVVFGKSSGFSSTFELSNLNGSNGFTINGINNNDLSGASVSNAGDVNGDGIDDLIIGASSAAPNNLFSSGQSYVIFGKSGAFSSTLNLSSLNGNNGFTINGINSLDGAGIVSNAGDVNGDGIDDLIIGANGADPNNQEAAGESYVVFGNSNGFSATLELSSLNGSNGFTINGINQFDLSGISVSSAGDFNGDGFGDLIISASYADPNGKVDAGQSYVVFGKSSSFASTLELSNLNGSNGFVINGINSNDRIGFSRNNSGVSSAGDLNGDGFDDLIISGYFTTTPNGQQSGQSYVIFGHSTTNTNMGTSAADTLRGTSANDSLNGLGGNDLLLGNGGNDTLIGGNGSDILNGGSGSDRMVGGSGHDSYTIDRLNDLVIEAFNQGTDLVRSSVTHTLSNNVENLILTGNQNRSGTGNNLANRITGNSGNNLLRGNNGNDTLVGNNGNDTLNGGLGSDRMQGGLGDDFYFVNTLGDQVIEAVNRGNDLVSSSINYQLTDNVENLILSGNKNINGRGNIISNRITGNNGNNNLAGNGGSDVLIGLNGNDNLIGGSSNDTLIGGNGHDTLTGNTGSDSFRFNSPSQATDTITDYSVPDDTILINRGGFNAGLSLGVLKANQLVVGASASDTNTRFIYNSGTGDLFFDRDGTGGLAQQQIANLSPGLSLSNNEFIVI